MLTQQKFPAGEIPLLEVNRGEKQQQREEGLSPCVSLFQPLCAFILDHLRGGCTVHTSPVFSLSTVTILPATTSTAPAHKLYPEISPGIAHRATKKKKRKLRPDERMIHVSARVTASLLYLKLPQSAACAAESEDTKKKPCSNYRGIKCSHGGNHPL